MNELYPWLYPEITNPLQVIDLQGVCFGKCGGKGIRTIIFR